MSQQQGWREEIDEVDARLIDGFQSGFPIEERPFRAVGATLGVSEDDALARVRALRESGIVRRFGAVLNPPVIGSSALAAVQAPAERFGAISAIVNEYKQVNHNYRRDHDWNMWFVITAGSRSTRDRVLSEIEARSGCDVLVLPMETDFYINLEFPVVNTDRFAREDSTAARGTADREDSTAARGTADREDDTISETVEPTRVSEEASGDLSAFDARVLMALQDGLSLTTTPYRDLAHRLDAPLRDVLDGIQHLLATHAIKRIGCVVNHIVTGFDENCMVVWDVPDDELDARGRTVGALPYVTLCYHRPRRPEHDWPYNLFTMIHGRDADAVDAKIDELAAEYLPVAHERLHSTETLKQTGARYDALLGQPAD